MNYKNSQNKYVMINFIYISLSILTIIFVSCNAKTNHYIRTENNECLKHGKWYEVDSVNTIHRYNYKRGKKNGKYYSVSQSGYIEKGRYRNDSLHGVRVAYSNTGVKIMVLYYYKGRHIGGRKLLSMPLEEFNDCYPKIRR